MTQTAPPTPPPAPKSTAWQTTLNSILIAAATAGLPVAIKGYYEVKELRMQQQEARAAHAVVEQRTNDLNYQVGLTETDLHKTQARQKEVIASVNTIAETVGAPTVPIAPATMPTTALTTQP